MFSPSFDIFAIYLFFHCHSLSDVSLQNERKNQLKLSINLAQSLCAIREYPLEMTACK